MTKYSVLNLDLFHCTYNTGMFGHLLNVDRLSKCKATTTEARNR